MNIIQPLPASPSCLIKRETINCLFMADVDKTIRLYFIPMVKTVLFPVMMDRQ